MIHAVLAVMLQVLLGMLTGRWRMAAVASSTFFIGREIAQAEYRWIAAYGAGKRANMPWWGGLDPAAWTAKSVIDVALPVFATAVIASLVVTLRKR